MTQRRTKREQHTIDKHRSRKVFKIIPVSNKGMKSCRIDSHTVIFIPIRASKKKAIEAYWKTHTHYDSIYNSQLGGRVRKDKTQ